MPNDLLVTTTDILGIEVAKDYSGASGIYVDNVNNIISITGDVGKEYNGIEPIVVNNEENLISANSAPIGVQEPLYFVQDDDEAVIIGLSGEYVTPSDVSGKLDTSSFESWQQGQYTNDLTAINEKINEVSSNIPSLEGYATEQWVEDKGYLTEVDLSNYYTKDETSGADQIAEALSNLTAGDIEVNELVHSNSGTWNTVTDKLDTSAQIISSCETTTIDNKTLVTKLNEKEISAGYAGSAAIANIALKDYQGNSFVPFYAKTSALENKLDTTAFSDVSGSFLTAVDLSNYYTKDETSGAEQLAEAFNNIPQGDEAVNDVVHTYSANGTWLVADDITGLQEKGDYYSASNPSGFLVSDDISDLASISLVEDTSASITALIPTDYYPNSNPSGFITGVDLSNYYQKNETSSKEEISAAIAAIPLGDEEVNQAVHTNSATWNTVTDKLDTTSFSEVSGTFLTAHQSLDGYATETLVEETSGAITSLIPTDYYPDTNPSGFISDVPDTYLQNTDLTIVDNKVTEISGVPLSAGDEFPVSADEAVQYVQSNSANIDDTVTSYQTNSGTFLTAHQAISADEWNSNYETVNTNSGVWGGSALPISAGPGIKVNLVDNTLVFSNDETVLYTANAASNTIVLSEKATNFERLRLELQSYQSTMVVNYTEVKPNDNYLTFFAQTLIPDAIYPLQILGVQFSSTNGITYNMSRGVRAYYKTTSDWGGNDTTDMTSNIKDAGFITKIVGINRKE